MFIVKRTEYLNQTYDLRKLNMVDWPQEAKELARQIIAIPHKRRQLEAQLPGMKKDWLINKLENHKTPVPGDL
jgi:hypothetical protein